MRHRFRANSPRTLGDNDPGAAEETRILELEPGALGRLFVAPDWLRNAGVVAWLIVGIVLVVMGLIWLLDLTSTIVLPVITAALVAAVTGPIVGSLQRRGLARGISAMLVLLAFVAIGAGIVLLVLAGVTSQLDNISSALHKATDKLAQWVNDVGASDKTSGDAATEARSSVNGAGKALLDGVSHGLSQLASLAVFATFTILSLFFMLKDGPVLQSWVERHSGLPQPVARTITSQLARAMRGYFGGVTIIAAFTAVIVGGTALIIGVPLAGTIAVVTFLGGYIPYLGAWVAGAFAVLLALGGQGPTAALVIAIVSLLGNGILQQMVQPIAFGATLDLHPLAVLIVTISAGALFGILGLVLAAPVTSAIVRISAELARARVA